MCRRRTSPTAVIVQIEHQKAAGEYRRHIECRGIDGVFIGPYDLSASSAFPDKWRIQGSGRNPQVSRRGRKWFLSGSFPASAEAGKRELESGVDFIAVGIDISVDCYAEGLCKT